MTKPQTYRPSASVVAQVLQLSTMTIDEIKVLWRKLYQQEPPTHVRTFLEKRLAYKLQEVEFKQRQPERAAQIEKRVQQLVEVYKNEKQPRKAKPIPGTVLTRGYQGKEYQVTVTHDGQFEFEGRLYQSLSVIAREITGTRWSGPAFFGLRKNHRNKNKKQRSQQQ